MISRQYLRHIPLAPTLAAMSAAVMLLLTFVILQWVSQAMARQAESDIGRNLAELAFQTTDKLDREMYERYREVQLMAERTEITDPDMPVGMRRSVLERMQATHPYYAWIGMTDTAGNVIAATKGMLEGKDVSRRPWFSAAYRGVHVHDVHEAVLLAKLLPDAAREPARFFDIAFPYANAKSGIGGVLATHLSWQWAQDVERSVLRPLAARKAVDALILSQDGAVLLGPASYAGRRLDLESVRRAQRGLNAAVTEVWPDGERYLVGYSQSQGHQSYPGLGWTVLVRQPVEQAFAPIQELRTNIFWFGLAAAGGVSLLVWIVSRSIINPLEIITRHAEAVRAGHAHAIPPVNSRLSEVQILQRALNGLLSKLLANENGLRELNATLETRVEQRTAALHRAMAETQKGERRVKGIIDTALDAFVGVDAGGRITDWNPRAEEIFGWSREEAMGRTVTETIIPYRFRHAHENGMQRFSIAGSSGVVGRRIQLSALRRDGQEFPIEMTIGLINADETHFFGTFIQDISARQKIEDELARERELLNAIVESIDVGIVVCSSDGNVTMFNRAAEQIHRLPAEPVSPGLWSHHYGIFHKDGTTPVPLERIPLFMALHGEVVENVELVVQPADAPPRAVLASGRALHAGDGSKIGAVIAFKDVTTLKESTRLLEASERRLRTIADNLPVLIGYVDKNERYQFANATYEAWFGVPAQQIVGKTVREVLGHELYVEHCRQLDMTHREATRFDMAVPIPGGFRTIEITRIPDIQDNVCVGVYVLGADISAVKHHEAELNRLARVDTLTGLPNRRAYREHLAEAVQRARRNAGAMALMFLDVDHFKQVNDTLGHAAGDVVLQEFARRVRASVRATDMVCRLAGDEFTVILEGLQEPGEAARVAGKIIAAFDRPIVLGQREHVVTTSVGVAYAGTCPAQDGELETTADRALYLAKNEGRHRFAMLPAGPG